jgi:hypothetical protein
MPRTPVTGQLLHQLLDTARADSVALMHITAVVEHRRRVLLLHRGDGDTFSPARWEPPTGLLLAPQDTLMDVIDRVITHTAGLDLDQVTGYLGHHDGPGCDGILRTFGFTVTVTDPARTRRSALLGHQWIALTSFPLPLPPATTETGRHFTELAAGLPAHKTAQPPPAAALRACAAGIYPTEAGVDLLINHATFLHRQDFTCFVHTGTSLTDGTTPMADIDWPGAITALSEGRLPCSGGEGRMLRLAASIAAGIPADMRDCLTGIDATNLDRVVQAVLHTSGRRAPS